MVLGLGGSGKSQLVLNFVRQHQQRYSSVFWVEAGKKETIERDYLQIYKLLCPDSASRDGSIAVEDAIAAVKNWLYGQHGRSLWVMDSADTIENENDALYIDLNHYLPDAPQLDRIITTRSSRAQGISTQDAVVVANMGEDEAVHLFKRCARLRLTDDQTEQDIVTIVQSLGYFALAVTLAGTYVHENPELSNNLGRYLTELRTHRERVLSQKPHRLVHQYGKSLLGTWELSFRAVQRQSPVAARLLNLLAFLSPGDIFLRLFKLKSKPSAVSSHRTSSRRTGSRGVLSRLFRQRPLDNIHRPHQSDNAQWLELLSPDQEIVNINTITTALETLRAYSLISWRADQNAYVMHDLVHAWGHDRLSVELRQKWSVAVLELLSEVAEDHWYDLSITTRLVPHMAINFAAVSAVCGSGYQINDRFRDSMNTIADFFRDLGRSNNYTVLCFLMPASSRAFGSEDQRTLEDKYRLAWAMIRQLKYNRAERLFRRIIKAETKALGHKHGNTLSSMDGLATALALLHRHEEAVAMYRHVVGMKQRVLGPEHTATLSSMYHLAFSLRDREELEEAEDILHQVLRVEKKQKGLDDPDTLRTMSLLASTISEQGQHRKAETMNQEVLQRRTRLLGLEHPDTLTSLNNLALTIDQQGRIDEAEKLYRESLDMKKKILGHHHPSTVLAAQNLIGMLEAEYRDQEAEEIRQQSSKYGN